MADKTKIEWTDATWNPITGCSVVSPGCTNCYAMKLAGTRLKHHPTRSGLTIDSKAGPVWNGQVRFNEKALLEPLRWKRPRMIFVCAHGDLFAENVPDEWIDKIFAVMALCPQHTFQVLTKRPERMREYMNTIVDCYHASPEEMDHRFGEICIDMTASPCASGAFEDRGWPLLNVWLGVSVEDQRRADERIPELLATPAAIRFISAEPLLGPVDLTDLDYYVLIDRYMKTPREEPDSVNWPMCRYDVLIGHMKGPDDVGLPKLDWVIVGGESGPGARPMHPDWARSLRDQCTAAGVPFFFKQWGNWREAQEGDEFDTARGRMNNPSAFIVNPDDGTVHCFCPPNYNDRYRVMLEVGKKAAGRLLDGVEHNAMPEVNHG